MDIEDFWKYSIQRKEEKDKPLPSMADIIKLYPWVCLACQKRFEMNGQVMFHVVVEHMVMPPQTV